MKIKKVFCNVDGKIEVDVTTMRQPQLPHFSSDAWDSQIPPEADPVEESEFCTIYREGGMLLLGYNRPLAGVVLGMVPATFWQGRKGNVTAEFNAAVERGDKEAEDRANARQCLLY
jgi:hypothetical protein